MAIVSAEVRFAPQLTAWFTANPTKVLQDGEIVYCSDGANVGKYVIGDNSTQLSALTFYGGLSSSGLTIGTTTITSGTNTRILYNNNGVLGEYAVTGTGTTAVLSTSPTILTPAISGFATFASTGTPPSGEPNYFTSVINTITGNQYNIRSTYTVDSVNNNSAHRIGGVLAETYIAATNTGQLGDAVGSYGYVQNYGTGLITRVIGSYNILANRSTGAITNVYGDFIHFDNDSTGTITNNFGLYIETPTNNGTITNNYGLYIQDQNVGTNKYALYSAGANDTSYFNGNLTVSNLFLANTSTQTPLIFGGTVAGAYLTIKGTSGNGTASSASVYVTVGNNGNIESAKFYNDGNIIIGNASVTGQRLLRVGQDTAYVDIGSLAGATSQGAIYFNQSAPSASNYALTGTPTATALNADGTMLLRISAGTRCTINSTTTKFQTNSVIMSSAALATTATDGFLYVPSCAGVPTGVPTAQTGTIAIVADSTNNKLYIYSGGAWVALN